MPIVADLILSGLAIGAMYAIGTISLSMIWGSLGMLNVSHGAILAIGGYGAFQAVALLGLPWWMSILGGIAAGILLGALLYHLIVRWLVGSKGFEINIIIATFAAGVFLQNLSINVFGAEPRRQPFSFDGAFNIGTVVVPNQTIAVLAVAVAMTAMISYFLGRTAVGRSIRAVSQNRIASTLVGIDVERVFLIVVVLASVLSAVSGVLLTSMTTIYPTVGFDPMLKALMICVVAGLGSLWGAAGVAVLLGLFEVGVQYIFGARFGLPGVLTLVIAVLIVRPYGLFGKKRVVRI